MCVCLCECLQLAGAEEPQLILGQALGGGDHTHRVKAMLQANIHVQNLQICVQIAIKYHVSRAVDHQVANRHIRADKHQLTTATTTTEHDRHRLQQQQQHQHQLKRFHVTSTRALSRRVSLSRACVAFRSAASLALPCASTSSSTPSTSPKRRRRRASLP